MCAHYDHSMTTVHSVNGAYLALNLGYVSIIIYVRNDVQTKNIDKNSYIHVILYLLLPPTLFPFLNNEEEW